MASARRGGALYDPVGGSLLASQCGGARNSGGDRWLVRLCIFLVIAVVFVMHDRELHISPLILPAFAGTLLAILCFYAWYVRRAERK